MPSLLHAAIEEFAAEGYTHVDCSCGGVGWAGQSVTSPASSSIPGGSDPHRIEEMGGYLANRRFFFCTT